MNRGGRRNYIRSGNAANVEAISMNYSSFYDSSEANPEVQR